MAVVLLTLAAGALAQNDVKVGLQPDGRIIVPTNQVLKPAGTQVTFPGRPNYDRVENGLYLGGYVKTPPPGTKAVLNLCELEDPYKAQVHRWEPIKDVVPKPQLDWLRKQVEFIDAQRKAERTTYIHCRNGVNRSGMVMAAYLMSSHGWTRDETMKFLRTKRLDVRPNPNFMELLLEWEKAVKSERKKGKD
jgi:Dual specificity phosphatase, catalytic domain